MPVLESAFRTHQLREFLLTRAAERGKPCTLTGMGDVKGRWMINDADYPKFFDLLHDYLFNQKGRPQNFVEQRRPDGFSPLLIDLDFKYDATSAITRRFDQSHITNFIKMYVNILKGFYDLSAYEVLRFFVCMRPLPYEQKAVGAKKVIKDGIHIECPDIVLNSDHQQIIRAAMMDMRAVATAFQDTDYTNADGDVYDESVLKKNGWFFYGESKPDIPAYNLTNVVVYNPDEDDFSEEPAKKYGTRELMELLSIRYNIEVEDVMVRDEVVDLWTKMKQKIRGVHGSPTPSVGEGVPAEEFDLETGSQVSADDARSARSSGSRKSKPQPSVASTDIIEGSYPTWFATGFTPDEIRLARQLTLECLAPERADSYGTWMEVGWCLHNIDSSDEMFDVWMEFSRKSPKFAGNDVYRLRDDWRTNWKRSLNESRKLKLGSLHLWAKQDNPEHYKALLDSDIVSFIERDVDATHTHLARVLYRMFWDRYKASINGKTTEWFEFDGIVWRRIPQGMELRRKISTDVTALVDKAKVRARRQLFDSELKEETVKIAAEQKMKKFMLIEKNLYNSGFKDSIMKEAGGIFYEEEFAAKLNMNSYLVGCANGVLDLRADSGKKDARGETIYCVNFRPGRPDDYVSNLSGRSMPEFDAIEYVPYTPETADEDPSNAEIDDFMSKVFPQKDLREYMWRLLASCLEGANKEQCYYTWTGVGGNGKSKLVELMRMTLGDYVSSLQATALTRKRPESGAANPDIVSIRNKRFIYLQEPDEREPLNTSRMKQFSGEDIVEARGLFEDQQRFKICGKLFMMCNKLPPIHSMDRGTWRRIRVIPFISKFVEPDSADINPAKHIYPRDDNLDMKLRRWREAFFARLVYVYETEYMKKGLAPIPDIVLQESLKYKESFDVFAKFRNMHLKIVKDGSETILNDAWRVYTQWHASNNIGPKLNQNEFQKKMDEEFGESSGKKKVYRHLRIIMEEDEEEE
jgi:P4 family phage/plasmid primase-like protien